MDSSACNYDSTANTDNSCWYLLRMYYDCDGVCLVDTDGDGTCDALEVFGCTESTAFNYDAVQQKMMVHVLLWLKDV